MASHFGSRFLQASDLCVGARLEALRLTRVGEQLAMSLQIRSCAGHFGRQPEATRERLRLHRSLPRFPLDARDPLARELTVGPKLLQALDIAAQSGDALFALHDHTLHPSKPLACPFDHGADLERCVQSRTLFVESLTAPLLVFCALADPSR